MHVSGVQTYKIRIVVATVILQLQLVSYEVVAFCVFFCGHVHVGVV